MDHKQKKHGAKAHDCKSKLMENLSAVLKNWKSGDSCRATSENTVMLKNIEKKILCGSSRPIPPGCEAPGGGFMYPNETKYIFHYRIQKLDNDHTVLDDTRKYGKTMELYSGKEFQLDFWEICLSTMLPGEIASFTVPVERLGAFPPVNKKLRDYMLNKRGSAVKHCCGFMSLQEQGGLGYADLDELMIKPEPLEFIFDLIRVEPPGTVRKETWIMTPEEKVEVIPKLRQEGNELYIRGNFEAAAARYSEALELLDQLCLREKPGDPEWIELDQKKAPLYLNLAQCQFKLKDFYAAIENTTQTINRDPSNLKAFYRRSKAYAETWEIDLAIADMQQVAKLEPDMSEAAQSEIRALQLKKSQADAKQRKQLASKLLASSANQ